MTAQDSKKSTLEGAVEHAQRGKRFLPPHEEVLPYYASARTLTSILEEAAAPSRINLLSLDVEGVELEVLKGLDFEKYKIEYILVETNKVKELADYLALYHYVLVDRISYHDYLFKLDF